MTFARSAERRLTWILPVVVVLALMSAAIFTTRAFATDWVNNLWLVWEQSLNIRALGHPSYFLNSNLGVFQPEYLFYGGTFYTVGAYLAILLGDHVVVAYILLLGLSVIAAYAGWWWIASQVGLQGWLAQTPALLFVTSSYYVANLYGRGDTPEETAVSMIPLVAAAGLWLARAPRWRPLPLLAFIGGIVMLSGSHPETFIWGTTFLVAIAVILLWALTDFRNARWRRIVAVAGVAILALCVNGWTLIPTAIDNSRLLISSHRSLMLSQLNFTAPGALFSVARDAVTPAFITGTIQTQLPTLAIIWSVVGLIALRGRAGRPMLRMAAGLGVLLVIFAVLAMLRGSLDDVLPYPWRNIQFPYRLVTYGTLAGCGLVLIVLFGLRTLPGRMRTALSIGIGVVCVVSVGAAMKQIWSTPSFVFQNRSQGLAAPGVAPASYYPGVTYSDISAPVVTPTAKSVEAGTPLRAVPALNFPYSPVKGAESLVARVPRHGATVLTNIATGPYLVRLHGAVPVGRTTILPGDGVLGHTFMVIRLTGKPGTLDTVTVAATRSSKIRASLWLSGIAAAGSVLLVLLAWSSSRVRDGGRFGRLVGDPVS